MSNRHCPRHLYPTALLLFLVAFMYVAVAPAQTATPPAGAAPAGDVLRPGHYGRMVGDIERMVHFYHDLLGLGLRGERNQPLPFWTSEPINDFVSSPKNAEFRVINMPVPGSSIDPGKVDEMMVEAIEYRNIERHLYMPGLQDSGVSNLILLVRNLDAALVNLKKAGVPVITAGGEPVTVPTLPGLSGASRAIMVRDPDGNPVELLQLTPEPASNAPGASNILGAHIALVVADLAATRTFYHNLIGADLKTWTDAGFRTDAAFNQLRNTPGAEYRLGTMLVPGSSAIMEFIQYRNITSKVYRPVIQDIGVSHVAFMVKDIELILSRLRIAGVKTLGLKDTWYALNPDVKAIYTRDPDGFFLEVMERRETQTP